MNRVEEFLQTMLAASEARKEAALRVLRGESPDDASALPPLEPYLTLKELAERLGFSPCSLWRWRVPGHALGGRRRFRLSEVSAYLESDDFKRRAAALRAERKPSAKGTRPEARNSKP